MTALAAASIPSRCDDVLNSEQSRATAEPTMVLRSFVSFALYGEGEQTLSAGDSDGNGKTRNSRTHTERERGYKKGDNIKEFIGCLAFNPVIYLFMLFRSPSWLSFDGEW